MRIEDTSWQEEIRSLGYEYKAAGFKRWFRRDGEHWIFAGPAGQRFRLDTDTAAGLFAKGVDIEARALAGHHSASNLAVSLPLGFVGMVPLILTVSYGLTPLTVGLWVVYLGAAFAILGRSDLALFVAKCRLRRDAARELAKAGVPQWRSFVPLRPVFFAYDIFGLVVVLGILAGFVLAQRGVISGQAGAILIASLFALSWAIWFRMKGVSEALEAETDALRGKAFVSSDVARRVRRPGGSQ